ncbi:MAG: sulfotransferase family protein [Pseudolabrys sp.]
MLLHAPLTQSTRYYLHRARAYLGFAFDRYRHPDAADFYSEINTTGYAPNAHIDALPEHRLIYVSVPKSASTSIKMLLSHLIGRHPSPDQVHRRSLSGLPSPFEIGPAKFHRLVTDPATLRFTFVRNPYDRLVSAWADKFQGRPLRPGNPFIDQYLALRPLVDPTLPGEGMDELDFADFVTYAAETAVCRLDAHWEVQDDIVAMPGLTYDLIGRVETFDRDIVPVLDHIGADATLRRGAHIPLRTSARMSWQDYYTPDLARRVRRAYERDFDRFGYRFASFA